MDLKVLHRNGQRCLLGQRSLTCGAAMRDFATAAAVKVVHSERISAIMIIRKSLNPLRKSPWQWPNSFILFPAVPIDRRCNSHRAQAL